MTKESPYSGKPESEWLAITEQLVASHPLNRRRLRDAVIKTWSTLWQTTVGAGETSVKLTDLNVPATVVGYFFEVLLARELATPLGSAVGTPAAALHQDSLMKGAGHS